MECFPARIPTGAPSAREMEHFSARNASGVLSAQEIEHFSARIPSGAPSAQDLGCFSARNASGVLSAQDLGCFSAWEAVGIPFRAGNDTFFCPVNRDGYTNREGYLAKFDLHKVFEYEQCSQDIHSK